MADELNRGDTSPHAGGVDLSDLPAEVVAPLAAVLAGFDGLAASDALDLDGRSAEAVAAVMAHIGGRASVRLARMLPVIEADGLWSIKARSLQQYAAREFRTSVCAAQAQVRLGRALRDDLPVTAVAAAVGEIGVEHAHVLASLAATTERRRDGRRTARATRRGWSPRHGASRWSSSVGACGAGRARSTRTPTTVATWRRATGRSWRSPRPWVGTTSTGSSPSTTGKPSAAPWRR